MVTTEHESSDSASDLETGQNMTSSHIEEGEERADDRGPNTNKEVEEEEVEQGKKEEGMEKKKEEIKEKGEEGEEENEEKEEEEEEESLVPIDRGWAWVTLAGAMLMMAIIGGQKKNFGLLFVAYQTRYQSSASVTSLAITIQGLVMSFVSLLNMTVGMRFISPRVSVMVGGLIYSASYIITAFSEDIRYLFVSVGVLEAAALAMTFPPSLATIGAYFNKRRGLANSLTLAGASLGGFVFAPIITLMFDNLGFTSTMCLSAGILLHISVAGALMRSPSFWTKNRRRSKQRPDHEHDADEEKSLLMDRNIALNLKIDFPRTRSLSESVHSKQIHVIQNELRPNGVKNGSIKSLTAINGTAPHASHDRIPFIRTISHEPSHLTLRKRGLSHLGDHHHTEKTTHHSTSHLFSAVLESVSHSEIALYASCNELYGSVITIDKPAQYVADSVKDDDSESTDAKRPCNSIVKSNAKACLGVLFDVSLLCHPSFLLFLAMAFLVVPAFVYFPVVLAPYAKDVGLTGSQISVLLSVTNSLDLVSRVAVGVVVDRKWIKKTTILAVTALVTGTAQHLARFCTTFESLMVLAVIAGVFSGLYMALYSTILVDLLTLAKLKSALGFSILIHGLSMSSSFAVVGNLRDITGSYVVPFHFFGAMVYVGGVMAIGLPYLHKWHVTRTEKAKTETDTSP